jgi:hypothetical protein
MPPGVEIDAGDLAEARRINVQPSNGTAHRVFVKWDKLSIAGLS